MKKYLYIILLFLVTVTAHADTVNERAYGDLYIDGDVLIGDGDVRSVKGGTDPAIRVYSADGSVSTDYIDMYHDQSEAILQSTDYLRVISGKSLSLDSSWNDFMFKNGGTSLFYVKTETSTDQLLFGLYDLTGNQLIISNSSNVGSDHDHATTTDPTLFVHSDLIPDVSNNQWGSLSHNQEDFIITTGSNVGTGSGATTDDNAISLQPRGSEVARIAASGVTISNAPLKVGDTLQVGNATTYSAFYQDEGDIYSNDGKLYTGAGINTVSERYGVGLLIRKSTGEKNLSYNIDATFTAATATIEKAGETFVSDGVIVTDFLVITDANDKSYIGSTGEILKVNETQIVVSIAAAGDNAPDNLTDVDIVVYNHPIASILDNGFFSFEVGPSSDARFEIHIPEGDNFQGVLIEDDASVDSHAALEIQMDADTYGGTSVIQVNYDVTAFDDDADSGIVNDIVIKNNGASGGHIHTIDVELTNASTSSVTVAGLAVGSGIDPIHQEIGTQSSIGAAYLYDASLTSYTNVTSSFSNSTSNATLFSEDNDQILISSPDKFDQVNINLSTYSGQPILAVFEYIKDDGTWVVFSPADGSNNFTQDGAIKFSSAGLTTWGQRTINEVTGDAGVVDLYWIRITRTRNNLVTKPIEETIRITTIGTEFIWNKYGDASINTISVSDGITAPATAPGWAQIFVDTSDGNLKVLFGDGDTVTIAVNP